MLGRTEVIAVIIGVAIISTFTIGYREGAATSKDAVIISQKKQIAAAELASRKEAERLAAEADRDAFAHQLEDAANAQAPSSVCLPVSRVLRLNQR